MAGPDCRVFPSGFPMSQGEPNATGKRERIPLRNIKGVIGVANFIARLARRSPGGLSMPTTDQPDPGADCFVDTNIITPFDDASLSAARVDGMQMSGNCRRCAHRVACSLSAFPTKTP